MKTAIIVQARMTSSRLPGKVLKEVNQRTLLDYLVERLRRVRLANQVIIATTTNTTDKPIIDCCEKLGCDHFRGSENDVLSRYFGAAVQYGADLIVRVTSDCPLIDPAVIDKVIRSYQAGRSELDYVSNTLDRTFPRGMDCEIFSTELLTEVHTEACAQYEREHVTPFIYQNRKRYRIGGVKYHSDESHHRWTVDTPEDFKLIKLMLESLFPHKPEFNLEDCLELINKHPEWEEINKEIVQKALGE